MKNLNFETIEELTTYLTENNLSISNFEIVEKGEDSITEVVEIPENVEMVIESLSSKPKLMAKVGESNILYVDSCESVPGLCATSKIKFCDKIIWVNVCDSDGKKTAKLDIAINEKSLYNVSFIIKEKTEGNSVTLEIDKRELECQKQ